MERQRDLSCLAALTALGFVCFSCIVRAGFSEFLKNTTGKRHMLWMGSVGASNRGSVNALKSVHHWEWKRKVPNLASVLWTASVPFLILVLVDEVIFAFQAATKTGCMGALGECSRDRAITQIRTEMFYSWLSELKRSRARLRCSVETGLRC